MALPYVMTFISGVWKAAIIAITSSSGSSDANKHIATNSEGKLDATFLPAGLGASTFSASASEALSASNLVNLYNNGGSLGVRKADGSTLKEANGFVLTAFNSGELALVYPLGEQLTGLTGLTPGSKYYLSVTTPGGIQSSAPDLASGVMYQEIGKAISSTALQTVKSDAIEVA